VARGAAQSDVRGGGGVHAPFLRADKRLMVFLADDNCPHPDVTALRQGAQGFHDQRAARRWVPFHENHFGFERSPLQLPDKKARGSPDAQDEVTGVVVVAKVGDESDVCSAFTLTVSK